MHIVHALVSEVARLVRFRFTVLTSRLSLATSNAIATGIALGSVALAAAFGVTRLRGGRGERAGGGSDRRP